MTEQPLRAADSELVLGCTSRLFLEKRSRVTTPPWCELWNNSRSLQLIAGSQKLLPPPNFINGVIHIPRALAPHPSHSLPCPCCQFHSMLFTQPSKSSLLHRVHHILRDHPDLLHGFPISSSHRHRKNVPSQSSSPMLPETLSIKY